jgi:hypothetical protein
MSAATSATSATQTLWEELRQDTMRNTPKNAAASDGSVSEDIQTRDADNTAQVLELVEAKQKSRKRSLASSEDVSTSLENVGPNTYERIRQNAGRTYIAQAMAFTEENSESSTGGLHKST